MFMQMPATTQKTIIAEKKQAMKTAGSAAVPAETATSAGNGGSASGLQAHIMAQKRQIAAAAASDK